MGHAYYSPPPNNKPPTPLIRNSPQIWYTIIYWEFLLLGGWGGLLLGGGDYKLLKVQKKCECQRQYFHMSTPQNPSAISSHGSHRSTIWANQLFGLGFSLLNRCLQSSGCESWRLDALRRQANATTVPPTSKRSAIILSLHLLCRERYSRPSPLNPNPKPKTPNSKR